MQPAWDIQEIQSECDGEVSGQQSLEGLKRKWQDIIKVTVRKIGCGIEDLWIWLVVCVHQY
jgi:hypothetical protein